jgi:hypothetical protein
MCFDNLINFYALHHYYIAHDINQLISLQACFKWQGDLFFKKEKNEPKHLKSTFSSKKSNKMKQKIKNFE